jgi:hypothetical protein
MCLPFITALTRPEEGRVMNTPQVHTFDNEGDAYDQSQYRDDIHDGDVLVTPYSVGILLEAWPTSAFRNDALRAPDDEGAFHLLGAGYSWNKIPQVRGGTKDYTESFELARKEWERSHG